MIEIHIPGAPVTKKNSSRILVNRSTGRPFVAPSQAYKDYERVALAAIHYRGEPIEQPVNVRCLYYMPTHRRVDALNLQAATDDILVRAGVLADDHSGIVAGHDGTRVRYDKDNPRTEIYISPIKGDI